MIFFDYLFGTVVTQGSKDYAEAILEQFREDYGKMNVSTLSRALGGLYELGKIVTQPHTYDQTDVIALVESKIQSFCSSAEESLNDFHTSSKKIEDVLIKQRQQTIMNWESIQYILLEMIDRDLTDIQKRLLKFYKLSNTEELDNIDANQIVDRYHRQMNKFSSSLENKYNQAILDLKKISDKNYVYSSWYQNYERLDIDKYTSKFNSIQQNFKRSIKQEINNYSENIKETIENQNNPILHKFYSGDFENLLWKNKKDRFIGMRTATNPAFDYLLVFTAIVFFIISIFSLCIQGKAVSSILTILVTIPVFFKFTRNLALAVRWKSLYYLSDTEWVSKWKKQ